MEELEVNEDKKEPKQKFVVRSLADLQRIKLEKLMKNPDKPMIIPEQSRERDFKDTIPSFVRNVMGSSAGAGSGEFHVYRHLRRKEYARQKFIQQKSLSEKLDQDYKDKIEKNQQTSDAKTAKKRAKRLKRKLKIKINSKKPKLTSGSEENNNSSSSEEKSDDEIEKNDDEIKITESIDETKNKDEDVIEPTATKVDIDEENTIPEDEQSSETDKNGKTELPQESATLEIQSK